uniref:kinesin-associated protein 3-like isoform X2 n=1 Tax=Styela clava TaxID=7725 RepID=UPI0019398E19|nr:kinesin-associated protein 3-like isoform X2 [Styela clava]
MDTSFASTYIEVHPVLDALIVHYSFDCLLGEDEELELEHYLTKQGTKLIRLRSLNSTTDIAALAEEVIEKCKLIHVSKLPEVEQLLYYLQKRPGKEKTSGDLRPTGQDVEVEDCMFGIEDGEQASINDIDNYVELLYEDIPEKIRSSSLLLQLTRNPDNLEELLQNETVLGALARVLREDWKKSVELSTNIIYIYFCFSTFSQFHGVIIHFKIGALCMSILEYELSRHKMWNEELDKKKQQIANLPKSNPAVKEFEKTVKKCEAILKKQDQLLRVGFYLLLNLSEDASVEVKMKKRGIVGILVRALETRDNPELLVLVVSFLKKLSIFLENKNEMRDKNVVKSLVRLIPTSNEDLLNVALRLLLNLSFDKDIRKQMMESGLIPKLDGILGNPLHRVAIICILYNLTMDEQARSLFSDTKCIPTLIKFILECKDERADIELVSLGINIATDKKNTQVISECINGRGIKVLLKRAFKFKDTLMMKMIRNMSEHAGPTKQKFIEFISALAKAITTSKDEAFVIECTGTLSNLTLANIDYKLVLEEYKLVPYIKRIISGVDVADDLILETVMLIGTVAIDDNCAALLAKSGIVQVLISLLNEKQEDDEIVLQIVYVFYQMIWHEVTRNVIVEETQAPSYLLDLLHDRNNEIRKICDATLDIIMEFDKGWEEKIRVSKFHWHNSQWIDMIKNQQFQDEDDEYMYADDPYTPYIHEEDILNHPELYYEPDMMLGNGELNPELMEDAMMAASFRNMMPTGSSAMYDPTYNPYESEIEARHHMHSMQQRPTTPDIHSGYGQY